MEERDKELLKEYIATLLSDLINERVRKDVKPYSVGMTIIQNTLVSDAKGVLNRLCLDKVLTFHKTINDVSFEFTPPK